MASPPGRILLADADSGLREDMRRRLEAVVGFQVVAEAGDGETALGLARALDPDIAILDCALPLMDGVALTRALRHELPRTGILVHTLERSEDVLARLLRTGARGYVLKSDPPAHLVAAVDALLAGKPYFSGAISATLLDRFVERAQSAPSASPLTPRELDVVRLVAEGLNNREVADRLSISIRTVETHRAAAMQKIGVRTTAELVRYAVRHHLIEP
jgi:DNA-binding NarL/FixJ family response regulator